jgi:hypothetical protein
VLGSNNTKNVLFNQLKSETLAKQLGVTVPTSHERIESVSSDEDILVGLFKDGDYDGFMVTNFTDPGLEEPKTATVEIAFNKATQAVVIEKGERRVVDLVNGVYTASIGSGSAQFIIPFN